MIRLLLIVIGVLVVGSLAWRLMIDVMSFFTLAGWFIAMMAMLALVGYCLYFAFVRPKVKAIKEDPKNIPMMLHQSGARSVYVFRMEPELADVVKIEDELHKAKLELSGEVFQVDNDTAVIVLEDKGREAVKIRIKSADKKSPDRDGWVCRSVLLRADRTLPGSR